uniref:Uncharacterized protein n=1 Tax=Rhabditophanes sp. KR3021 TaxID=114890 RepID=A0AC35UCX0_9BILA
MAKQFNTLIFIIFLIGIISASPFYEERKELSKVDCPEGVKRCITLSALLRTPSVFPSWKQSFWKKAYSQHVAYRDLFNNGE